jgi:hypothetical protein
VRLICGSLKSDSGRQVQLRACVDRLTIAIMAYTRARVI